MVPVMTMVPVGATVVGEKLEIVGAETMVKLPAVSVTPPYEMVRAPLVAAPGTVTVS